MTTKRSLNLTIPILVLGLIGMCGFLWFEYRQAKQKARSAPAAAVEKMIPDSSPTASSRGPTSPAIVAKTKASLSGTSDALSPDQTEQLVRLLAAKESNSLSPEIVFGAQRFLSPAQMAALKKAYAEARTPPVTTPVPALLPSQSR